MTPDLLDVRRRALEACGWMSCEIKPKGNPNA